MKLFHSLLVAPATLGLLAPLSANATEVNLNEISNYSDVESIEFANSFNNDESNLNPLLAGGEGLIDDHSHDGGFSETTTASFSADFYLGSEDTSSTETSTGLATDNDLDDSIMAGYSFQIDLNTSFTGEDSLDISLDAGNSGVAGIAEFDGNGGGDKLAVDGVAYTFPVGGATVFVGDNSDGSSLFTTACVYGGPSNTLDDCANVNAGITGGAIAAGASYDFGNGFTVATGMQTSQEVLTEESLDGIALNAAYTGENYGVSLTYSSVETSITEEDTATAFNAYYTPEGLPSISVGYETVDIGGAAATADEKESVFAGLTWDEVGPGSLGVALGYSNIVEGSDEAYMYEAYYSYPVNDGMTITPLVFVKENATAGQDDTTGVMVKSSFSF
jgi:hypothetical protein